MQVELQEDCIRLELGQAQGGDTTADIMIAILQMQNMRFWEAN